VPTFEQWHVHDPINHKTREHLSERNLTLKSLLESEAVLLQARIQNDLKAPTENHRSKSKRGVSHPSPPVIAEGTMNQEVPSERLINPVLKKGMINHLIVVTVAIRLPLLEVLASSQNPFDLKGTQTKSLSEKAGALSILVPRVLVILREVRTGQMIEEKLLINQRRNQGIQDQKAEPTGIKSLFPKVVSRHEKKRTPLHFQIKSHSKKRIENPLFSRG
jgi:hypothetical protein